MHCHAVAHPVTVDETNVSELRDADIIFLAIDASPSKKRIIEKLQEFAAPFIDVGTGIYQRGTSLAGIIRPTTGIPEQMGYVWSNAPFEDDEDDEYGQNIQVADLNMLNAALAVIRWKKLCRFYVDLEQELSSL